MKIKIKSREEIEKTLDGVNHKDCTYPTSDIPKMPQPPMMAQTAKWGQCPSGLKGNNEI